jgi:PadR family transcriptional regulator, regulatory protein PadR
LILRVLALERMHGWAIAQRIGQISNEQLRVGQSALYWDRLSAAIALVVKPS